MEIYAKMELRKAVKFSGFTEQDIQQINYSDENCFTQPPISSAIII
jgi:hypothetical protein